MASELTDSGQLVTFFISGLEPWRSETRNRVLDLLNSCDLGNVRFDLDNEFNWIVVRCLAADKRYIQMNIVKIEAQVEAELAENNLQANGNLETQNGVLATVGPNRLIPPGMIEVEVPAVLHKFNVVTAVPKIQMKHQWDGPMDGAMEAIDRVCGTRHYVDELTSLIFIGAASQAAADSVTAKLKTLRRNPKLEFQSLQHTFFAEEQDSSLGWKVDARDVKMVHPLLAPSTLFDPKENMLREKYNLLLSDTFCLRICYRDPFKEVYWSTFGPRAEDVFGGREPTYQSRICDPVQVIGPKALDSRSRHFSRDFGPDQSVPSAETKFASPKVIAENDPITLGNESTGEARAGVNKNSFDLIELTTTLEPASILDEPVTHTRRPPLQRPLRPDWRTILIPSTQSKMGLDRQYSRPPVPPLVHGSTFDKDIKSSLQRLMRPMTTWWGMIRLRAELGRFYLHHLDESGVACNKKNEPASGWKPEELAYMLKSCGKENMTFTKILSYWGNDADFLANMGGGKDKRTWKPVDQCGRVFFDFLFSARNEKGQDRSYILEVDGRDFSWFMRKTHDAYGPIYVHCLSRNWDFRLVLSHDCTLGGHNSRFDAFAGEFVKSLVVSQSGLEYQFRFGGSTPVTINDVRVRKVRRFRWETAFLDITRVHLTEVVGDDGSDTESRKVRSYQNGDHKGSTFTSWFEASVSSARMEELLKQNEKLQPGDEVEWTLQQLEEEQVFEDIYKPACEMVKKMDGVGVKCDNGQGRFEKKFDNAAKNGNFRF